MTSALPANDTIAAIATAAGAGGVGIIRLSGPHALSIAQQLTGTRTGRPTRPREARFVRIRDQQHRELDQGLLLTFPGPHSFTGEDVAELHCHGGPVLLRVVLRECIAQGARQAEPGEFSQRAFINDKIDLVQAEAIADLISSGTEAAVRSASRSLSGRFSEQVNALFDQLVRLRVFVEAAIDFPEEEIDFIADSDVLGQLTTMEASITALLGSAQRGRTLRDGLKLVIAGAPNAGKSSLLNQLAEYDSAIVSASPGTTRDLLREHIQIDGVPLHIVDTAGLRSAPDEVEQEGIRRARAEMRLADHILLVVDNSTDAGLLSARQLIDRHREDLPSGIALTVLRNKCDLCKEAPGIWNDNGTPVIRLSARDGQGMDLLRAHLLESAGLGAMEGSDFSARERHVRALEDCLKSVTEGRQQLLAHQAGELIAEDLRYAQDQLGRITGRFDSDALLGEIFSSFCIGK